MKNNILNKYARVLVNYSVNVEPGDTVLIQGKMLTQPLIKEVYKESLKAGGHPVVISNFEGQEELFYKFASESQLNYQSPFRKYMIENMDKMIRILGNYNTRELTNIDPEKMKIYSQANKEISEIHARRTAEGELNWNICQYPTQADAQEAKMSLSEYKQFVYEACHLDRDDPVAYWKEFGKELKRIASIMEDKSELRFVSEDTDVKCKVEGRNWIADQGKENYPGGEVFTGPLKESVEGHIRFSFPGIYQGREIEDIRLTFAKGKVVEASASKGEELLKTLLETDAGARYVGEVAIGCNKGIKNFSRNMLFDEKIGGTIHFAIGRSFPETGAE
ncbi:MAG: aminopeptidase, partial [Bacillota bacterium]